MKCNIYRNSKKQVIIKIYKGAKYLVEKNWGTYFVTDLKDGTWCTYSVEDFQVDFGLDITKWFNY